MSIPNDRSVQIGGDGRSGPVTYREAGGTLSFHWELGGGDVVVIIQCGNARDWEHQRWALPRRSEIVRFVADEVIRQKLPTGRAEIDEGSGVILLRQVGPPPRPRSAPDVSFVRRLSSLKAVVGIIVLMVSLIIAGLVWSRNKFLVIDPGKGVPLGPCVRTDTHLATLIRTLEAYTPSLHRDGSKDRFTVSIYVVPLDGSAPKLIPIVDDRSFPSIQLAKVLGSDGRTLWFDVNGIGGVDLRTYELLGPGEVRDPFVPRPAAPHAPAPDRYMSAGSLIGPGSWLGLHSTAEVDREFSPGKFVRRVVHQPDATLMRRCYRGTLSAPVEDRYHRILTMEPVGDAEYLNAAFLRMDDLSEPFQLRDPESALMVFTSAPGPKGTLVMARVDHEGRLVWRTDTGIDRFTLQQILPGEGSTAFVGTRPREEGRVPEPLLVIVEHRTGAVASHSLWQ